MHALRPALVPAGLLRLRGGSAASQAVSVGLTASSAALVKNIMGIGVLTIAAGIAAGTGSAPAAVAIVLITFVSAYSFALIGHTCEAAGLGASCTFKTLWAATLGPRTAVLVDGSILALTFSICAVYLICLAELLPPLLALLRAPRAMRSRRAALGLAFAAILPLCMLRDLGRLAFSSYVGVAALGYTAVFSVLRWADGTYQPGGRFHALLPPRLRPQLAAESLWRVGPNTAVLVANLGVALCAHFNAPQFYRNLARRSPRRFDLLSYSAFGAVALLTLLIALTGYYTFGDSAQQLILNNYHPARDGLATAARVASAGSLVCSFPLVFAALRESALSLLPPAAATSRAAWTAATLALPAAALALALALDDLGLAVGLLGSVLGGAIIYVFPAAMHAAHLVAHWPAGHDRAAALAMLCADAALLLYGTCGQMIAGTYVTWARAAGG